MVASDGAEAWAMFQRELPPMVILDWQMPGLDGLEVCRLIREHAQEVTQFAKQGMSAMMNGRMR